MLAAKINRDDVVQYDLHPWVVRTTIALGSHTQLVMANGHTEITWTVPWDREVNATTHQSSNCLGSTRTHAPLNEHATPPSRRSGTISGVSTASRNEGCTIDHPCGRCWVCE